MISTVGRVALLALALLAAARDGAAADRTRVTCFKQARTAQNGCQREAQERCRSAFETALRGCMPEGNSCVPDCLAADKKCTGPANADLDGCKLACAADQKVGLQDCKVQVDMKECQNAVRVKALKCKQRCTANAATEKGRCRQTFDGCLQACSE